MEIFNREQTFTESPSEDMFLVYKKDPSLKNRNIIVNKYLYLAEIISRKFLGRGTDYEDIFQIASIALIKAVERFNPEKGVKFVSFATPTILGEIKRFFRDKAALIRVPRRIYELYQKVNSAKEELTQKLHRIPKVNDLAEYLGLSEESILEIIESWNAYNIVSFSQTVYEDEDVELHETIGHEDETFVKIENRDFLKKSLDKFDNLEKQFIHMRYFDNRTQKSIADKMGVSQMYVSRLERKVMDKFRRILNK